MPSDLNSLITEATRYARFTMKKSGSLAPMMMASTDNGIILFSPNGLNDTGAKDDFASKVRLITASYGASAVVRIVESWITKAQAGGKAHCPMERLAGSETGGARIDRRDAGGHWFGMTSATAAPPTMRRLPKSS